MSGLLPRTFSLKISISSWHWLAVKESGIWRLAGNSCLGGGQKWKATWSIRRPFYCILPIEKLIIKLYLDIYVIQQSCAGVFGRRTLLICGRCQWIMQRMAGLSLAEGACHIMLNCHYKKTLFLEVPLTYIWNVAWEYSLEVVYRRKFERMVILRLCLAFLGQTRNSKAVTF